jgi:hypothetical protein
MLLLSSLVLASIAAESKPLMRDFIGLNTHTVQFKTELYKPVAKLIRNYHPVEWDLANDPNKSTTFPKARNGVDWMSLYGEWKKQGFVTEASAMFESIKRDRWTDIPNQAFRYGEAVASYFGPSGKQPVLEAVEIGNEPTDFSDSDYRSLFENMAKGLRKGDPKMLVSTCAVAVGKEDKYSKDVEILKGLDKLYDVLNVHSYAFVEHWPTWRRTHPEDRTSPYLKQIEKVIEWRDKNAPGKKIWLTEFGYDASTKSAPPTGDFSKWVDVSDDQQAQFIVRSYAVFSRMKIDRAYLFWFNDEDQPQLHGSSGITRNYLPKPSYHALAHMQKTLGGYRFARPLVERTGEIYLYEFVKPNSKDKIWMTWSPTGSGRKARVELPPHATKIISAQAMPLSSAAERPYSYSVLPSGRISLEVSESPVYLHLRG